MATNATTANVPSQSDAKLSEPPPPPPQLAPALHRNRSPPISVPSSLNNAVVIRNRHFLNIESSNSSDSPSEVTSAAEWRLSTDSGTHFDDVDLSCVLDDMSGQRRISTGAESGYYGSPFNTRSTSTPVTISSSSSMFTFDESELVMNMSRQVMMMTPTHLQRPTTTALPFMSPSSSCNDVEPVREKQQLLAYGCATISSSSSSGGTANDDAPVSTANDGDAFSTLQFRPQRGTALRSVGTQTSFDDVTDNARRYPDEDEPNAIPDEEDNLSDADDAFLPDTDGSSESVRLPDVIPSFQRAPADGHYQRHRAHSVSLPARTGRCLASLALQFDDDHRRSIAGTNRQNAPIAHPASFPGDNGGFLSFLRASLKSRRRSRSQSASEVFP